MKSIANIRVDYSKKSLEIADVLNDPIAQFKTWFDEAVASKVNEPNAMTLSTLSIDDKPTARVVLLKGVDDNGFTFFTNYESNKGSQLASSPFAALTFFWPELERQVRIEGITKKVTEQSSDEYFNSRPRGSQIGAHTSAQSKAVRSREELEETEKKIKEQFEGKDIPRPSHWGGYTVEPNLIEFWQGRTSRLHDRILYCKEGDIWVKSRLAP